MAMQRYRPTCKVEGCCKPIRGKGTQYATMCCSHDNRYRKHGHHGQRRVTKAEIAPYERLVNIHLKAHPDALKSLVEVFDEFVERTKAELHDSTAGWNRIATGKEANIRLNKWETAARQHIVTTAANVEPEILVAKIMAFGWAYHDNKNAKLFMDDRAYLFQIAQGFMCTYLGNHRRYDSRHSVMKYLPPRMQVELGRLLNEALAVYGFRLADSVMRKEDEARMRKQTLDGFIATAGHAYA